MSGFECHITTRVADALECEVVAKQLPGWKTSEIKRDPVLGDDSHFYLTAHDTDFQKMWARMTDMRMVLEHRGVRVLREKIELIVHDRRFSAEGQPTRPL